ncbi:MAG: PQQ-dependent sugar dehydrogenase [Proteobacteria bacterium]|nr:MAG: PQQ-dependent sugar dehydrogenase [Pseudomonadota bacterium]QKK10293.1 MAG: PQQ-dependent sugar dehydrogenase [Pseudomonadota bacterium]
MKSLRPAWVLLVVASLAGSGCVEAAKVQHTQQATFEVVAVADNLEHPWGMAFLPDGALLVTERPGRLRLISAAGVLQPQPIAGVPEVVARGQGGLLDVALHPDFRTNRLLYLSYAGRGPDGVNTEVVRARFDGRRLHDARVIFRALPKTGGSNHYGSRLLFDRDGYLFVTLGDRYNYRDRAQSIEDHLGTIVRLHGDGGVPADNPFVDRPGAQPEIYSYGHRNVQGIALRPGTNTVWAHEHGPRGGDEVNILRPGANYGWPAITYGIDYSGFKISDLTEAPGMEQPVVYWDPSIAPSGMAFYSGTQFPQWQGDLFVGALAKRHLRRLELQGDKVVAQEVLLGELRERIRDVRSGPDGFLYLLTDSSNGKLWRLEPRD